jgi:Ser/Thr protein kinase RdoA (MazF antagonist)
MHAKPDAETPPRDVLAAYALDPDTLAALEGGLINRTWSVCSRSGQRCVVQRVNPLFGAETQHDILSVTEHFAAIGIPTTRIVRTPAGAPFLECEGSLYRVLTYVEGVAFPHISEPRLAAEAGRVLAVFHRGLASFAGTFRNQRANVHVLSRHLAALETSVATSARHPAHHDVALLADRVMQLATRLPTFSGGPVLRVHGDPKISNVLFEHDADRAICLVDLDTLTEMPILLELGDAFRSWCNPEPEDSSQARFSCELFAAACRGYLGVEFAPPRAAWPDVPVATAAIAIELAARFCADAVNESYFLWDSSRFASASEHNQARTLGQLAVASGIIGQLDRLTLIARESLM